MIHHCALLQMRYHEVITLKMRTHKLCCQPDSEEELIIQAPSLDTVSTQIMGLSLQVVSRRQLEPFNGYC